MSTPLEVPSVSCLTMSPTFARRATHPHFIKLQVWPLTIRPHWARTKSVSRLANFIHSLCRTRTCVDGFVNITWASFMLPHLAATTARRLAWSCLFPGPCRGSHAPAAGPDRRSGTGASRPFTPTAARSSACPLRQGFQANASSPWNGSSIHVVPGSADPNPIPQGIPEPSGTQPHGLVACRGVRSRAACHKHTALIRDAVQTTITKIFNCMSLSCIGSAIDEENGARCRVGGPNGLFRIQGVVRVVGCEFWGGEFGSA